MRQLEPLRAAAGVFRRFTKPWFVCGGWAIDLFVGRQTREHLDVEIGVFREDQRELRQLLADFSTFRRAAGDEQPWRGERLDHPVHELVAKGRGEEIEVLLNERAEDAWVYRRHPAITRPLALALRERDGIPYLAPEIVLLYKSKGTRPKDAQDFATARPLLSSEQAAWLALAIDRAGHSP